AGPQWPRGGEGSGPDGDGEEVRRDVVVVARVLGVVRLEGVRTRAERGEVAAGEAGARGDLAAEVRAGVELAGAGRVEGFEAEEVRGVGTAGDVAFLVEVDVAARRGPALVPDAAAQLGALLGVADVAGERGRADGQGRVVDLEVGLALL